MQSNLNENSTETQATFASTSSTQKSHKNRFHNRSEKRQKSMTAQELVKALKKKNSQLLLKYLRKKLENYSATHKYGEGSYFDVFQELAALKNEIEEELET